MLLQWNLMCRSSNTKKVSFSHLLWKDDALQVYFRKQKNDQDGARSKHPRHVYANPIIPEACPILALAIWLLCCPPAEGQTVIFGGAEQDARFNSIFQRFLELDEVKQELARRGFAPSDFGSHSIRKGASTFVSAGTTDAPPQISVILRGGWTLSKIEKTYFRFEKAGDQYVGRMVCGLPVHSVLFAMLPPMFQDATDEERSFIDEVLRVCFPGVQNSMFGVLRQMLASVVYHVEWIRASAADDSPIFNSPLFSSYDCNFLKKKILCVLGTSSEALVQATGIPAHVSTKLEISELKRSHQDLIEAFAHFRGSFEQELKQGLNDFATSQGHLTLDVFRQLLDAKFAAVSAETARLLERQRDDVAAMSSLVELAQHQNLDQSRYELYSWREKLHLIP